jgi:hypothetical protein
MARGDYYASAFGTIFSAYMERPRLSRVIGRAIWGGDIKGYYESMAAVAQVPHGGTVVDCPCRAGPALRAVPVDGSIRSAVRRSRDIRALKDTLDSSPSTSSREASICSRCQLSHRSFAIGRTGRVAEGLSQGPDRIAPLGGSTVISRKAGSATVMPFSSPGATPTARKPCPPTPRVAESGSRFAKPRM